MEVAGVVEFDEVADAIEGADESGWGNRNREKGRDQR
jgi:hypothetical protein